MLNIFNNINSQLGIILASTFLISYKFFTNDDIDVSEVFFIIMVFNVFGVPSRVFTYGILYYFEMNVVVKRINRILQFPD